MTAQSHVRQIKSEKSVVQECLIHGEKCAFRNNIKIVYPYSYKSFTKMY